MDIKDSYLHGTVGVVKSIDIDADKLIYKLADVASTTRTIPLPLATTIANGLMSKEDKMAINSLVNYVTLDTTLIISGAKTFSSLVEFTSEDGIAPFVVTSNTVVTNLNADRLDGLHSFDFIKYDYHIDSSTTTMSTRHIGYSYAEYGFMCSGPAISIGSNDGYIMQILQEANSSNTYIRYGNPDGFGAWKRLAFVGEATVSNADMLDGLHASDFVIQRGHVPTSMANVLGYGYEDEGWKRTGPIISFGDPSYYAQIQTSYNDVDTVMRINNNGVFSDWKAIAFTDGIIEFAKKFVPRYITNLNTDGINEFFSSCFQADNRPTTRNYATGFTVYNDELAFTYQFAFDTYGDVHTRYKTSTEWQPWRRLAFTTDTVEVANKLSTTRYLWGQPFDGSGDVYGDLKSMDGYNFASTTSNYVLFGYGYAQNNKTVYLDGSPIYFRYGTNHRVGMILNSNGNVTVGEDDSASSNWKLYVNGNVFHNGVVATNNLIRLYGKTNVSSDVYLDNTTHSGLHIRSSSSSYMLIGNNVGIGTTNPQESLDVNGNIRAVGYARLTGDVFINSGTSSDNNNAAGKLFFGGSNSTDHGVYLSATKYDTYGRKRFGIFTTNAASETPNWIESFSITPGGSVGINTTTPRNTLDVNGSSVIDGYVYLKGVNRRIYFYNSEGEGLLIDNNGINWHNTNDSFAFNIMTFSSNKRVGIGTTTPRNTLDVNGSVSVNGVMNFINQGNLITVGGDSWANNTVLYTGYDTINGDWTKLGVAGAASNSASLILTHHGRVGIGVDYPTHDLHINGAIKAEYNPDYNLAHDIVGETHFYNDSYSDPAVSILAAIKVNGVIAQSSGNVLLCTTSGNVGIGTVNPAYKLDVDGNTCIRGALFLGASLNIYNHDQINGTNSGIALNYNCGKYVNTSIWDGQAHQIMRVFGEGRQVAIGAHSIDTPRGTLNVDGEVIFEQSRFTTTSGFLDGDYAYSHAIYGGYHGIDVCEFYENEFKFKTNGGDITSFTLNRYYADFNGTVRSFNCDFTGVHWNGRARFRLVRDGEYNTWLQAATDTANEGGKLFMSGYNGTTLSEFNVYASKSTLTGALNFANNTWNKVGDDVAIGDCNNSGVLGVKSLNSNIPGFRFYNSSDTFIGQFTVDNNVAKWNGNVILNTSNAKESVGEFGYVMRKYTIDASALDENTWYPVTILLNQMPYLTVRIECIVTLDSGTKPSWSTHSAGFSVRKIWEVNGHGWGTNPINRLVYVSDSSFATTDPVRGIGQLGNDSVEYVHVRGGGKYFFYTSHNKVPILRTSTYTASNLSVSPTTTVPRTILPTVDIYQQGYTTSTSISNLPGYKQSVICTISASGTLGLLDSIPEGRELHVIIKNTSSSAITITIPSTMINVMGENLKIDGNSYGELNILSCGSYYVRGVS